MIRNAKAGDRVQVVNGQHRGELGTVIDKRAGRYVVDLDEIEVPRALRPAWLRRAP